MIDWIHNLSKPVKIIVILLVMGALAAGVLLLTQESAADSTTNTNSNSSSPASQSGATGAISNFDECVAAGNPVMESFPEQCAANGRTFVNEANSGTVQAGTETFSGKLICLPKPGNGPQTLECAIGLQTADQKNYALKNNPKYDLPVDTQVTVKGVFAPAGDNETYSIVGTIDVSEIEKAE